MTRLDDFLAISLDRVIEIQPNNIWAGSHEGINMAITQPKHPLEHILFCLLKGSCLRPLLNQNLNFFFGYFWFLGRLDSHEPQDQFCGNTQQMDYGRSNPSQGLHGDR